MLQSQALWHDICFVNTAFNRVLHTYHCGQNRVSSSWPFLVCFPSPLWFFQNFTSSCRMTKALGNFVRLFWKRQKNIIILGLAQYWYSWAGTIVMRFVLPPPKWENWFCIPKNLPYFLFQPNLRTLYVTDAAVISLSVSRQKRQVAPPIVGKVWPVVWSL